MSRNEAERSTDVVSSTFSINSVLVKALFNYGATYSFISSFVIKIPRLVDFEVIDMSISIPTEEVIRCAKLFKDFKLNLEIVYFLLI